MASSGLTRNIDRRALKALDEVTSAFAAALASNGVSRVSEWERRIACPRRDLLGDVNLTYTLKNRFWARIYDLTVSTTVVRDEELWPAPQLIRLRYEGLVRPQHASFQVHTGSAGEIALALTREKAIGDLVRYLNLTTLDIRAAFEGPRACWLVATGGLIGSYTWNFIPPVFQAIRYREAEVHQHITLLAMVARVLQEA